MNGVWRDERKGQLDSQNPWPGLRSFTEDNSSFFYGRDDESGELARRVQQENLTLLFGKSGLGKTSLLRAGVSPILRQSGFIPIYIRLNHFEESLQLEDQVEVFIEQSIEEAGVDAPAPISEESLWEYFHKKGNDWWDQDNHLLKPVLIFDQFEEILTAGQENPTRVQRSESFLTELEDLVENRPPEHLRQQFKVEKGLAKQYDLDRVDYRVVLSLREDYLADLEGLRERLRMITHNRYRLLPMNAKQAMSVVLEPGGELVDKEVARDIVNFVAAPATRLISDRGMDASELKQIEPALLSIILRELNNHRLADGGKKISSELVLKKRPETILTEFYENSLRGMGITARLFIEQELLTASGARNRVAEEDAIKRHGMTNELIEQLITRRIIQREKTASMSWLELSHDTLTQVAKISAESYERQRRRKRYAIRVAAVLSVAASFVTAGYYWQEREQNLQTKEAAKLALDVADVLENNYTISMSGKQRIIDRLDEGFIRLRGFAGKSWELKEKNIRFLLTSAEMRIDGGYFQRALENIETAKLLLGVDEHKKPGARLLLVRYRLINAVIKSINGDKDGAWDSLITAYKEIKSTHSQIRQQRFEKELLTLRCNRIKVELLSERGDWGSVTELYKVSRKQIQDILSDHELEKTVSGLNIDTPHNYRYYQQLFSEALKIDYERTMLTRTLNRSDYQELSEAFAENLKLAERYFTGEAKRQWNYYKALNYHTTSLKEANDGNLVKARSEIDIAIDILVDLVRSNPDNLTYRYQLGRGLLRRAGYSKANDPLQAKVDNDTARALAVTLRRDSRHPYLAMLLSVTTDYALSELDYDKSKELSSAPTRLFERIKYYVQEVGGSYETDTLSLFASYMQINFLIRSGKSGEALSLAQDALGKLNKHEHALHPELINNRRYWISSALLNVDKKSQLNNQPWEDYGKIALESIDRILEYNANSCIWFDKRSYVLAKLGDKYKENEQFVEAERVFTQVIKSGLSESQHCSHIKSLTTNTIYVFNQLIKIKQKTNEWSEFIRVTNELLAYVDSQSGREIIFPKDELRYLKDTQKLLTVGYKELNKKQSSNILQEKESTVKNSNNDTSTDSTLSQLDNVISLFKERIAQYTKIQNDNITGASVVDSTQMFDPKSLDLQDLIRRADKSETYLVDKPLGWGGVPSIFSETGAHNLIGKDIEDIETILVTKFPKMYGLKVSRVQVTKLPFYEDADLLRVEFNKVDELRDYDSSTTKIVHKSQEDIKYYLRSGEHVLELNGSSTPIHEANKILSVKLNSASNVSAYLRFFCRFIQGEEGAFVSVVSSRDINWSDGVSQETKQRTVDLIRPITIWQESEQPDDWFAISTISYGTALFHAKFRIKESGAVDMLEDLPVATNIPVDSPKFVQSGRGTYYVDRVYLDLIHDVNAFSIDDEIEMLKGLAGNTKNGDEKWKRGVMREMLGLVNSRVADKLTNQDVSKIITSYLDVVDYYGQDSALALDNMRDHLSKFIKQSTQVIAEAYEKNDITARDLAGTYSNLSFLQLKTRDFNGALQVAQRGKEVDPEYLLTYTNYAHSLLLLGREEEAMQVYLKHKGQQIEGMTWDSYILDDFSQFEKLGITTEGMQRVRRALSDDV